MKADTCLYFLNESVFFGRIDSVNNSRQSLVTTYCHNAVNYRKGHLWDKMTTIIIVGINPQTDSLYKTPGHPLKGSLNIYIYIFL